MDVLVILPHSAPLTQPPSLSSPHSAPLIWPPSSAPLTRPPSFGPPHSAPLIQPPSLSSPHSAPFTRPPSLGPSPGEEFQDVCGSDVELCGAHEVEPVPFNVEKVETITALLRRGGGGGGGGKGWAGSVTHPQDVTYGKPAAVQYSMLASFPVLPTPAFVSQPWRKSAFLHGCETKAGVGRTGNEATVHVCNIVR